MADLIGLSTRIIDGGLLDEPPNRITQELSELAEGLAVVESFSHVVTFRTEEGLVCFDTSGVLTGEAVVKAVRGWSDDRVNTILYTHGHVDHVGGARAFVADAESRGHPLPRVVAHENVTRRFDRYDATNGYNLAINARQFGGFKGPFEKLGIGGKVRFLPPRTPRPDIRFGDRMQLEVGGLRMELRHARGETDDHLFAWLPERRILCAGDFFIWNYPNAGNPHKVQRYPVEWAAALREMAGLGAELFIPAHGLPIAGAERIARVLGEVVRALESVVEQTLEGMNAGLSLDAILHEVAIDPELLSRPYLRPLYDEPEFVVRNVWRLYGGWYDGNPAHLKPAPQARVARELAALVGGVRPLVERARELADAGEWRLACHLIELAAGAEPESRSVHAARREIYAGRRKAESSLMAKGIFGAAVRESDAIAGGGGD